MGDIVGIRNNGIMTEQNTDLQVMTDALLLDVRSTAVPVEKSICMPIAQLTTLGPGVSSLIPAFNSVT